MNLRRELATPGMFRVLTYADKYIWVQKISTRLLA